MSINLSPAERERIHAELKRMALRVGVNPDALPVAAYVLKHGSPTLPDGYTPERLADLLRWVHAAAKLGQAESIVVKLETEAKEILNVRDGD
ncbi:MAG: hypothetical protein HS116_17915 [Planctomycetes bacterium]|nr:hypothetical protein [Planctomycetota bacterium]MBE7465358.1 hypothetical protein [Planctomycetota bacterium]